MELFWTLFRSSEISASRIVVIQYRQCLIEIGKRQDRILVKKENQLGAFFFLGQDSLKLKITLKMRSCLQDAVINYAPRTRKFINKLEIYRQCPPRRVKNSHIYEIENSSCVKFFMNVTPVSGID